MTIPRPSVRRLVVALGIMLALVGCGGETSDDEAVGRTTSDTPPAAEGAEGAESLVDSSGGAPSLACPDVGTVEAITGVEIRDLSSPSPGDPTPLRCQYVGDDEVFSTGTAVYMNLDPVDTGPSGFGDPLEGIGEWAEVSAEDGVIYVGFGGAVLEVGTYAELTDDQLVALAEATIEAGDAG